MQVIPPLMEQFSMECRKTQIKELTLANYNGHNPVNQPIKIRSTL